jgi:hypothetical protein
LNRIQKKVYVPRIQSKNRPDELIAAESWRRFLLRNDSLLVEKFFGLQKIQTTCKQCGHDTIFFEPYYTVSLPLPMSYTIQVHMIIQLLPHSSLPLKVSLQVEYTTTIKQLKQLLIEKLLAMNIELFLSPSISSPRPSSSSETSDASHASHATTSTSADLYHFHFAVLPNSATGRSIIYQNYCYMTEKNNTINNNSGDMKIFALAKPKDAIIAFQLEYDLPSFQAKSVPYSPYFSSKIDTVGLAGAEEDTHPISGCDILIANICDAGNPSHTFSTSQRGASAARSRIEILSYPRRLSFPRSATTNHDIHNIARQVLGRTISPSQYDMSIESTCDLPYELVVTNNVSFIILRKVEDNSLPFTPLKPSSEILMVYWKSSALQGNNSNLIIDLKKAKEVVEIVDVESMQPSEEKKVVNIYDCFDKLIEEKDLLATDLCYCYKCKDCQAARKKVDFWSAPDILIVHLDRFQSRMESIEYGLRNRNEIFVDFPIEELDVSRYLHGPLSSTAPAIYDLYAVCHHRNHCSAICKNYLDHRWYV